MVLVSCPGDLQSSAAPLANGRRSESASEPRSSEAVKKSIPNIFAPLCFKELASAKVPESQFFHSFSGSGGRSRLDGDSPLAGSYIGVKLADVDADRAAILKLGEDRGVEVKSVLAGSPAEGAQLQPGDVLLSYNGENILGAQQLVRLVQETPPGRKVKLQFWRGGKARSTVVTTGSPPQSQDALPLGGFSLPERHFYQGPVNVPRPVMVWRNLLLGMEFEQVDSQFAEYFGVPGGVLIRAVEKGSPAEKSGLKTGDVIFAVGHKDLVTARDLTSGFREPGSSVPLVLMRNHKKVELLLTLPDSQ